MATMTTNVHQPGNTLALVSPLPLGNWFHLLCSVDGETNTTRIAQTYPPPLVKPPASLTTYGHSLVTYIHIILRKLVDRQTILS